ncbi:MAG: hypothetical protein KatS3mg098_328 [Candidatus Parcubacteria bacterium]|nr:MAG: hypothetical protein KatS3mg098_328 [Candidatus Parcubacteria bacterium]
MKYFIYCRKSTDSEEKQVLSIEAQLAELKEFAAKEPGRKVFGEMLDRICARRSQRNFGLAPGQVSKKFC